MSYGTMQPIDRVASYVIDFKSITNCELRLDYPE